MKDETKSKEELFRDPFTNQPRIINESEGATNFNKSMIICIS